MPPGPVEPTETQSESTRTLDEERRRHLGQHAPAVPRETRFVAGELVAGRYRIVRFLGRGGQGEVYEAEDGNFVKGLRVALKTISIEASAVAGAKERFEKEVLLARQVAHPNVCPTYDLSYSEDSHGLTCFLTMKLLLGETLSARLKHSGALPEQEGLGIIRQVAGALRAAHEAKIVHRDLKPGNIMLEGTGAGVKAVVTDFGLARQADSESTVVSSARGSGTPGYIAPEVLQGQPASPASDLYAFGVVVNQIFTGKRPEALNKAPAAVRAELEAGGLPQSWIPLVSGCLSADPKRRYHAFEEALEVLDPGSATGQSLYHVEMPERVMSRRGILIGAGVATACAVAGGAWWKSDDLQDWMEPLPLKRFVALLNWPAATDSRTKPMLSGVIDAIENALSRAEAFDRNLLVVAAREAASNSTRPSQLKAIRDSVGANLILATSGAPVANRFNLSLQVVDPDSDRVLRQRQVQSALNELASLPAKAVQAAARLLNVNQGLSDDRKIQPTTQSPDAYQYFQAAEALIKQPNDSGLEEAIEKYKAAIEADPRFVLAHGQLAVAYCRLFVLKQDPGALELARRNAQTALQLDHNSVQGHQALASVFNYTGKGEEALKEIGLALAADPTNPRTLSWQAEVLRDTNRWSEAEQTYKALLKQRPNYWVPYNNLGYLLDQEGRYDEAIQLYRTASAAAPRNWLPKNNVAGMALRLGNLSEAESFTRNSIALKPTADGYRNLASVLTLQGKVREALEYCLKAVELSPVNDQAWLSLADTYQAIPWQQAKAKAAYQRAAVEAERQLRVNPNDGPCWIRFALYSIKSGQSGDALAMVRKADLLGVANHDSMLYTVRIFELLGRRDEAVSTLASCFKQGTTRFEVEAMPDLQALRRDSRYRVIGSVAGGPKAI
jgi:serine/threonine protein kinase/tetratricopeptide (TPR) repeat protein